MTGYIDFCVMDVGICTGLYGDGLCHRGISNSRRNSDRLWGPLVLCLSPIELLLNLLLEPFYLAGYLLELGNQFIRIGSAFAGFAHQATETAFVTLQLVQPRL
jgi:hypothetical protein